ncbi:ATP-dependent helicase [Thalassotalea euphylliae]|uniref:ATP-dependent helicase n=1 Tax=Thalassotalea euphylliae TaxID=1655234 RepID=A0A3E0TS34_9GAMM|nr:DEAD/DEAH box helicase [Thalassotalea euphylliae]REL27446.1 ATP-dependent helicase [Thalassotalea euphylliae]
MSVDAIGLSEGLLKAVKLCGYKQLTPIQQQAIPVIRTGADILASAQTGTGKTAAFTLPILDKLAHQASPEAPVLKALILTPTRELAIQVGENIKEYSQFLPIKHGVIFGGAGMAGQEKVLKAGVDILVATPGRLLEHLQQRNLSLSQVKYMVLDEADRMLDMGFLTDIERITAQIKHKHQTLMFSATFSNKVKTLANQILHTPKTIEVAKQNTTSGKVKQAVYWVSEARKRELLSEIIGVNNWHQVMVFAGTRESANQLAKELKLDGIKAALCHGEKSQGARNKALEQFVAGEVRVLVATDVAARGLDIPNLPYVVNFHLPFLAEDYVHRVGRTGRAGKSGTAISLVSPKDEKFLGNIEQLIGRKFEKIVLPGYEMTESEYDASKRHLTEAAKKNRYQTTRDKNRVIAEKNGANKKGAEKNGAGKKGMSQKAAGKKAGGKIKPKGKAKSPKKANKRR